MDDKGMWTLEQGKAIVNLWEFARRAVGWALPLNVSPQGSNLITICIAEAEELESIVDYSRKQMNALKFSQDDHILVASLPDLWKAYSYRMNTQSAKLLMAHIHQFNVNAVADQKREIEELLLERAAYWRGLAQIISGEDTDEWCRQEYWNMIKKRKCFRCEFR